MKTAARLAYASMLLAATGVPVALVSQTPKAPVASSRALEPLRLGTVEFPTSGAEAAQTHFLHGVAALHSFWYEEALEAFAKAAEVDPDFAMAYWGEAMCYHRTYRTGTDLPAGRQALAKIKDTSKLTARERGYIEALRVFLGTTGSVNTAAYVTAMEKLHRDYPEDREAAAFHALALLAAPNAANREKAGEIANEVYRQNPNHPGAAHYIIHAYDDAERADRALPAAHQYAKIAPDAPHALHMPSHIFLLRGMWDETLSANDLGWAASVDYVNRKALAPTLRDYHNLHWLIYALLQQGRYARARELVEEFTRMRARNEIATTGARYIDGALAVYLIDTRQWDRATALFPANATIAATAIVGGREVELCGAADVPVAAPQKAPATKTPVAATLAGTPTFMRAYAAATTTGTMPKGADAPASQRPRVALLEGVAAAHAKDYSRAIAILTPLAETEAKGGKPIAPPIAKPANELLGEVLLAASKPQDAVAQFKISLDRYPGRALSVLGLARAEAAAGDKTAARATYGRLLEIWKQADANLPELAEARAFVKAAG